MNTPTIPTSSSRNAVMYSTIRVLIAPPLEYRTEMNVSSVVIGTSNTEMPSTPTR